MPKVMYYSPSTRTDINLNGEGLYIQTARELRGHKYSFKCGYRNISNVSNDAREIKLGVIATDEAKLDELRHMMDADLYHKTPGTISVGDYSTKVQCVGSECNKVSPNVKEISLSLVMLNPYWETVHSFAFFPDPETSEGIDYPHDYAFDYSNSGGAKYFNVLNNIPADFRLTIFGAAQEPKISIGNNAYIINRRVLAGDRIELDTRDKSITYISDIGEREDIFALGVRGKGQGSGEYCFEQLQPGENRVGWDGSYGINIEVFEKDTVPPWSL